MRVNVKISLFLACIIILISGCSNTNKTDSINTSKNNTNSESTYSNVLSLMSNEEWDQASNELNNLNADYKGTKILKSIINSNIELQKVSGNQLPDYKFVLEEMKNIPNKYNDVHSDLVIQYKKILFDRISRLELEAISQLIHRMDYAGAQKLIQNSIFIYMDSSYVTLNKYANALRVKEEGSSLYYELLFDIPMEYSGVLHDDIKKTKDEIITQLLDLVKKKRYEDALEITGKNFFEVDLPDYTLKAIESVISILKDPDDYLGLRHIPDDYNGVMSKDISLYKQKYKKELDAFEAKLAEYERISKLPKKLPPQIGMTPEEVRNSSWGSPDDINRTTTQYGVSEQWVYSNRYVYFDDGLVTVIQE